MRGSRLEGEELIGRPLRIDWREGDDEPSLRARYQAEKRAYVRQRLHALWLLRTRRSIHEVALLLGVHERSVQYWVAWYRRGGLAEVTAHRLGGLGKAPWLSPAQQAEVIAEAAKGQWRTAADARRWIVERFGVTYTLNGIYELLARLKCKPKVPRPLHAKASLEAQEAWKKGAWLPSSRPLA
jgi:transposase